MELTKAFSEFYENAKGGILLIVATILSLLVANSSFQTQYTGFWHYEIAGLNLEQWVNDGLMAIFFLMIGLELKREVLIGELSDKKNASLPVLAATGGMIVPAAIYSMLNYGTIFQSGAGIPMATDIAFAIGVLSLLGKRVPPSLKILLMAIAVIDDLGAIIVIAIFYTKTLSIINLGIVLALFAGLLILKKKKVNILGIYLAVGLVMWYFMLKSGVHATLAGILLAFTIPFGKGGENELSYKVQNALDEPVATIILPIFALANTAIVFAPGWDTGLATTGSAGIFAGLVIGKPLGIALFSLVAVSLGISTLPKGLGWKHISGLGFIAGIGFTMSIFITLLAFEDQTIITESKISILLASLVSGIIGFVWLRKVLKKRPLKLENKSQHQGYPMKKV